MNLLTIALSLLFIIVCSVGTAVGYYLGTGKSLWNSDGSKDRED